MALAKGLIVKKVGVRSKSRSGKFNLDSNKIIVHTKNFSNENYTEDELTNIILHEIGHKVRTKMPDFKRFSFNDDILDNYYGPKKHELEAIKKELPEIRTDNLIIELYANAYIIYKKNPEKLKTIAPTIFKEITEADK